jgi:hypothetical protein
MTTRETELYGCNEDFELTHVRFFRNLLQNPTLTGSSFSSPKLLLSQRFLLGDGWFRLTESLCYQIRATTTEGSETASTTMLGGESSYRVLSFPTSERGALIYL